MVWSFSKGSQAGLLMIVSGWVAEPSFQLL